MQAATDQKSGQEKDEIWFTEHHPVYTLGHAATEENIISTNDIPVVRTDRGCLLYTSPSPRDLSTSRMPSSA